MRPPRWCGVLFIAAAGLYLSWVFQWWLSPDADYLHGYASELGARDQPFSWFYRAGDIASGLSVLVAAWWCRSRPSALWALLAVFGAATIVDAALAMDCAPSIDVSCARREDAFTLSVAHQGHLLTSAIANTSFVLAVIVCAVWLPWRGRSRHVFFGLALLVLGSALATLIAMAGGLWLGFVQRGAVSLMSVWLLALGVWIVNGASFGSSRLGVRAERIGADTSVLASSGVAGAHFDWNFVFRELGGYTGVALDRPGLGGSPLDSSPRTLAEEVERIARAAGQAPTILVGHSVAALHMEAFARQYPRRVAGLVLVDPSWEPSPRPRVWLVRPFIEFAIWLAPALGFSLAATGLARWLGPRARALAVARMSRTGRESGEPSQVRAAYGRGVAGAAAFMEYLRYRDHAADLAELRSRSEFPDVPVMVIAATWGMPDEDAHRWHTGLVLLAQSLGGQCRLEPDAGHLAFLDIPARIAGDIAAIATGAPGPG